MVTCQLCLGRPPPNPEALEVIEELLEEGVFSDEGVILIEHLLLTIEEREEVGEPDLEELERANATDEIANIFEGLIEEDISNRASEYFRMVVDEYRRASRHSTRRAEHQRRMEEQAEQQAEQDDDNRRSEDEDSGGGKKAGSGDEAGDGGGFRAP